MPSKDASVFVQVGEKLSIRREMIKPLIMYLLQPLILILPVIGTLTWVAVVRGLYPLRELADEVSARTPQDMRPLQPTVSYAETEPLVHETNALLVRLALALEAERSFTADAAHELRTPLSVISAQTHVLAQSVSSEEKAKALQDLQEGVERTTALVKQLLMLARLDSQTTILPRRLEYLDALVRERIAVLSPMALEKKIDIELLCSDGIAVAIDRERFVSVIDNLIDNAFRYTPAKGHVQVSLEASVSHVLLRIADDGPGIPSAEREKAIQRFYRLPGTDATGSGLGLAIVQRVVSLHDGVMRLGEGLHGRGLSIEIELLSSRFFHAVQ
jgi:signal transduction histidine kinase